MADYQVNCPYCGEPINPKAKVCSHCGSDESTGWSQNTYLDGIDIDFEEQYEEIRDREFTGKGSLKIWQVITGGILLLLLVLMILTMNF